ncbi:hypothetical protein RHECNPAF_2940027 [Rhizobium etli CNPAF512]|nr:hypothetical protein RHECNPAF_2940027 [Rhizobium etli CNPAF512]
MAVLSPDTVGHGSQRQSRTLVPKVIGGCARRRQVERYRFCQGSFFSCHARGVNSS